MQHASGLTDILIFIFGCVYVALWRTRTKKKASGVKILRQILISFYHVIERFIKNAKIGDLEIVCFSRWSLTWQCYSPTLYLYLTVLLIFLGYNSILHEWLSKFCIDFIHLWLSSLGHLPYSRKEKLWDETLLSSSPDQHHLILFSNSHCNVLVD